MINENLKKKKIFFVVILIKMSDNLQILSNLFFVFSTLTNYFSSTANSIGVLNAERLQGAYLGDAEQRIATENLYKNTKKEVYKASCINILLTTIISVIIYKKYTNFSNKKLKIKKKKIIK